MRSAKLSVLAMVGAAIVTLAGPAHADPDTDFANQLHGQRIYGPLTTTPGWARSPVNDYTTA